VRILAVDTNSFAGSVALLENRRLLAEINLDSPRTHSERLLSAVDLALSSHDIALGDLDGFALAVGPGSFTGIRIGMSTVKSFAMATGRPIAPVSGLAALAFKLRKPRGRLLCPLFDARKQEVYGALYEYGDRGLEEIVAQGVYSPDQLFSLLPPQRVIHFLGTGVTPYRETIRAYFKDRARFPQRSLYIGHEIGLLGLDRLSAGRGADHRTVEPLYLRKSQAEENR